MGKKQYGPQDAIDVDDEVVTDDTLSNNTVTSIDGKTGEVKSSDLIAQDGTKTFGDIFMTVVGWPSDNDSKSYDAYRFPQNAALRVGKDDALTLKKQ